MFNYDIDFVVNSNEYLTPTYTAASKTVDLYGIKYKKDDISFIYKRDYVAAANGGVQIPISEAKWDVASYYQIRIEVVATEYYQDGSFMGREQGYGKPFIIEFKTPDNAGASYANDIKNLIKAAFNTRPDIWAVNSGVIDGTAPDELLHVMFASEYFMIKTGVISKLNEDTLKWKEIGTIVKSTNAGMIQAPGFGTYNFILRNLRVPTYAALRFYSIDQISRPIVTDSYTQYTIITKPKRSITGDSVVGEDTVSETKHIYYIDNSKKTIFESMFNASNANIPITTV